MSYQINLRLGKKNFLPLSRSDLGRGYKLNPPPNTSPLQRHVFQGKKEFVPMHQVEGDVTILNDLKSVSDKMDIKGELSMSYGPVSGSGRGEYLDEYISSSQRIIYHYRVQHQAFALKLNDPKLKAGTGDYSSGTKFIDSITYGGQLDVLFHLSSSKVEDTEKIRASLEGKVLGLAAFKGEVNKFKSNKSMHVNVKICVHATGGFYKLPSDPTLESVQEEIDRWTRAYEETLNSCGEKPQVIMDDENVMQQLPPICFSLAEITNFTTVQDIVRVTRFNQKVEELAAIFCKAATLKARLEGVKKELQNRWCDPADKAEYFNPYSKSCQPYLVELQQKLDSCTTQLGKLDSLLTSGEVAGFRVPKAIEQEYFDGILGDAYIKDPVVNGQCLGEPGCHFLGFAKNGKPWLYGRIRDQQKCVVSGPGLVEYLTTQKNFCCGTEPFDFDQGNFRGQRVTYVTFPSAFKEVPNVWVSFARLDMSCKANQRLKCAAEGVTISGFTLKCTTWADSKNWTTRVAWFACSSELAETGVDMNCPFKRSHSFTHNIEPTKLEMRKSCIGAALCALDMSKDTNIRLRANVLDVKGRYFRTSVDTWSDTKAYASDLSWFALSPKSSVYTGEVQFRSWNHIREFGVYKLVESIAFPKPFKDKPNAIVALSCIDFFNDRNARVDVGIERITTDGMTIYAKTWADTKINQIRACWVVGGNVVIEPNNLSNTDTEVSQARIEASNVCADVRNHGNVRTRWNGNAKCDGHSADGRAKWLVKNKGLSVTEAHDKVMGEFPNVFQTQTQASNAGADVHNHGNVRTRWNGNAKCDGHYADGRAKWLGKSKDLSVTEAQDKVIREFPYKF